MFPHLSCASFSLFALTASSFVNAAAAPTPGQPARQNAPIGQFEIVGQSIVSAQQVNISALLPALRVGRAMVRIVAHPHQHLALWSSGVSGTVVVRLESAVSRPRAISVLLLTVVNTDTRRVSCRAFCSTDCHDYYFGSWYCFSTLHTMLCFRSLSSSLAMRRLTHPFM